jgi:hypothetical protein
MEKRVTSLEVGKFETCRLLGISDSKLQDEKSAGRDPVPMLVGL